MFSYSRHAKNNLRLYKLQAAEVEGLLEHPYTVGPNKQAGKLEAWGRVADGRWLVVVYVVERGTYVIITIMTKDGPP